MSKAFRCDICGEYKDGDSTILSFKANKYGTDHFMCDICGSCHVRLNETFAEIAEEHNFINMFNNPENAECYDD